MPFLKPNLLYLKKQYKNIHTTVIKKNGRIVSITFRGKISKSIQEAINKQVEIEKKKTNG